jgi:hypothetical protein
MSRLNRHLQYRMQHTDQYRRLQELVPEDLHQAIQAEHPTTVRRPRADVAHTWAPPSNTSVLDTLT